LFSRYVDDFSETSVSEAQALHRGWVNVAKRAGITERLSPNAPMQGRISNIPRRFEFDYALGQGNPLALFQKALLTRPESTNSASLMLMAVTSGEHPVIPRERCAAVVHVPEDKMADPLIAEGLDMLSAFGTLVNVAREDLATEKLQAIANLAIVT
jgi:hypothetical protein